MAQLPALRVVGTASVGFDHVDIEAAERRGVAVVSVPDYCTEEVADHTLALLYALLRGVVELDRRASRAGNGIERRAGAAANARRHARRDRRPRPDRQRRRHAAARARRGGVGERRAAGCTRRRAASSSWTSCWPNATAVTLHVPLTQRDPRAHAGAGRSRPCAPAPCSSTRRAAASWMSARCCRRLRSRHPRRRGARRSCRRSRRRRPPVART